MEKSSKRLMPEISKECVAMWRQMNPVGRDRIDSFLDFSAKVSHYLL